MTASFADRAALHQALPSTPDSVSRGRSLVAEVLDSVPGVDPRLCADAELVLGELLANAVEHGSGTVVTVSVTHLGGPALEVVVRNRSDHPIPAGPWEMPAPFAPRGRGLAIASSLTTAMTVGRSGDDVVVTARIGPVPPSTS